MPNTVQSPVERLLRNLDYDPGLAYARLSATCTSTDDVRLTVRTRDHETVVDEPLVLGGHDHGPDPMELLLGSLSACQATTYRLWADRLGVRLDSVEVEVSGTLDMQGLLGADGATGEEGMSAIEVRVTLSGPDEPEVYTSLRRTVDQRSPVMQVLRQPAPVHTLLRLG